MTDKQIRPPYEIALMHDHILRLEEELQAKEQECEELKKTLTEIKNKLTVHKTLYYESKLIEKLHKQILQKISEVEDD